MQKTVRVKAVTRKKHDKDANGSQLKGAGAVKYCCTSEVISSVFNQCGREFVPKFSGLIKGKDGPYDPFSVHLFHPPSCLGIWAVFRETILVEGVLNRKNKEILGVFVSNHNKCNFCTQTHMLAALAQGADGDEMERALSIAGPLSLHPKKLGRIIEWVIAAQTRGAPTHLDRTPIPEACIPEILGVTFFFNYLNRVVDTFITRDSLPPLIPSLMKFVIGKSFKIREMVNKLLVQNIFGAIKGTCPPGDSINLMQQKPALPKEFTWAQENKSIAAGFGFWAGAMEDMANIYIPTNIKEFVTRFIAENYTGVEDHLTKQWAFMVPNRLEMTPPEKYATSFMVLVAFAPFEIDKEVLEGLKKHFPSDRMRRAFGMWSAFQTATTIACWQYSTIRSRRS